jgi:hypothetical protein
MGIPAVPLPLSHSIPRRPAAPGGLALHADRPAVLAGQPLPHGEARDLEQPLGMLRAAMDADRGWPNVWFIADHSDPHDINRVARD